MAVKVRDAPISRSPWDDFKRFPERGNSASEKRVSDDFAEKGLKPFDLRLMPAGSAA